MTSGDLADLDGGVTIGVNGVVDHEHASQLPRLTWESTAGVHDRLVARAAEIAPNEVQRGEAQ